VTVKMVSIITEDSCQAKVSDLQMTRRADEKVGRLKVAMHDVVGVAEGYTLQQHDHVALYLHKYQQQLEKRVIRSTRSNNDNNFGLID